MKVAQKGSFILVLVLVVVLVLESVCCSSAQKGTTALKGSRLFKTV